MFSRIPCAAATFSDITTPNADAEAKPAISQLWGTHGELWTAKGSLGDWSRAGYGAGDRPIPRPAVFSDLVVDWNAAGDGVTDDTQASPAGSVLFLRSLHQALHQSSSCAQCGSHCISLLLALGAAGITTAAPWLSATVIVLIGAFTHCCHAVPGQDYEPCAKCITLSALGNVLFLCTSSLQKVQVVSKLPQASTAGHSRARSDLLAL